MRHHHSSSVSPPPPPSGKRTDWRTVLELLPYLWAYRTRLILALLCMIGAKAANIGIPVTMKHLIDHLNVIQNNTALTLPIALLLTYGAVRLGATILAESREIFLAKVTQSAVHAVSLATFKHLHKLSLSFHLERQTGGLSRDIERGTRAISSLISFSLYSIVPMLIEVLFVLTYLLWQLPAQFAITLLATLACYIGFTVSLTDWRTKYRRQANELDTQAHSRAIDALINYETVKYFNNEQYEATSYDERLSAWEKVAIRSQISLGLLNMGQSSIIAIGVTALMWQAAAGVVNHTLSLGDFVLVNGFLLQLYVPLNFLGVLYREIKQATADVERLFTLLHTRDDIADAHDAHKLSSTHPLTISFENVSFAYQPSRQILNNVSFAMTAGQTLAIVGHSGSGKSTIARLIYRFYDVNAGRLLVNGYDVRNITQNSLRKAIGVVPQDTVLFNDSIGYNIRYGRPDANEADVEAAAKAAHLHDFIMSLPEQYATRVGERGLKLSGGEKQRVAIARTLLKNPSLLIFDEATSSLDSTSERAIQTEIKRICEGRTAVIIAHRLSTIIHANNILVMQNGCIVEQGTHLALLEKNQHYAQMWHIQQQQLKDQPETSI